MSFKMGKSDLVKFSGVVLKSIPQAWLCQKWVLEWEKPAGSNFWEVSGEAFHVTLFWWKKNSEYENPAGSKFLLLSKEAFHPAWFWWNKFWSGKIMFIPDLYQPQTPTPWPHHPQTPTSRPTTPLMPITTTPWLPPPQSSFTPTTLTPRPPPLQTIHPLIPTTHWTLPP